MVRGSQLRGYLVLTAVFLLGVGSGSAAAFAYVHQRHAALLRDGRAFEHRRLDTLARELDLDSDQRERIGAILANGHDEDRALAHDMFERCGQPLREHRGRMGEQLRALLRPDQQRRFDRMLEERRDRMPFGPPEFGPLPGAPRHVDAPSTPIDGGAPQ
jgi:hypothetical protein